MEKNLRGDSKRKKLDSLTERLSEGRITRRGFIKGGLALGFSFGFLSGIQSDVFATQGEEFETIPVPEECMKQVRKEGSKLNIYNWGGWWPEEKIYGGFSDEFDIDVTVDYFADMDELVTKFKLHPEAAYDVTLPDTRAFGQMKKLGILQELNHDWIPNAKKYLPEEIKNLWYDPGYKYGITTDRYYEGYGYNKKYVDPKDPRIPHWDLLFECQDYAGKVTMSNSMFHTIGSALKYLGFSYNSTKEDELRMAEEVLLHQKPWVMAYNSWPKRQFLEEEVWIAHGWVGDIYTYYKDLKETRAAAPPEGTLKGADSLVIPKGSPHPAAAHLFLNYMLRPKVNATLLTFIGYAPTHTVTPQLMPEKLKEWPGVVIEKEFWDRCEFIRPEAYTGKGLELRSKIWENLKR